jgi:hypothetical protein
MKKNARTCSQTKIVRTGDRNISSAFRFVLLVMACIQGYFTSAQTTIYAEDFETQTYPPTGWNFVDYSNGYNWQLRQYGSAAQSGSYLLTYITYPNASNAWAITPAVSLLPGYTYRLTYWCAGRDQIGSTERLKVTLGRGNTPADQQRMLRDLPSITGTAYQQGIDTFRVTTAGNYNIGFQCYSLPTGNNELRLDNIVLQRLEPCTGIPAKSTVIGPAEICNGVPFTLTLSEAYPEGDLGFQWQSAPAGSSSFTNIPGAMENRLTTTETETRQYRCLVTCGNTGLSTLSDSVTVAALPYPCYCKPSGKCNFAISNLQFGGINNSSTTCGANGYTNYTKTVAPAILTAGTTVPIRLTLDYAPSVSVGIWIDYDHSQTFDESEFKLISPGNSTLITDSIRLPANSLTGPITMRLRTRYSGPILATDACMSYPNGETEDYTVNILPAKVAIFYTPFADSLYTPAIALKATIKQSTKAGIDTMDSLKPRLWVKKFGAAAWKVVKGTLLNGTVNDGAWQFIVDHSSLGIRRNSCDSVQFYFVAQDADTLPTIGYAPEGGLHSNVQTQISPPGKLFGYRLIPRLQDTVYVSASDCRYQSLTNNGGLLQQINEKGLTGDLTILVGSDLVETGIHPVTTNGLNGHRLVIRPDTTILRTITTSGTSVHTLKLYGVKNVTVDGRFNGLGQFLRFRNQTYADWDTASNIKIYHGCDSITIRNTIFEHTSTGTYAFDASVLVADGTNQHLLLRDNVFQQVTGAAMPPKFIVSVNGENTAWVVNNTFNNFTAAGVEVQQPSRDWIIDSNTFSRNVVSYNFSYNFSAIRVYGGGHQIRNNYIGGKEAYPGQTMWFINNPGSTISGIETYASGSSPVLIEKNRIENLVVTYTSAAQTAIFNGILADESNAVIRNNIIGNPKATASTILVVGNYVYGINAYGNQPVTIENNIVCGLEPATASSNASGYTALFGINKSNQKDFGIKNMVPAIIRGNQVFNLTNGMNRNDLNVGGTTVIMVAGGSSNLIERNLVHHIGVDNYKVSGIYLTVANGDQPSFIQRNKIYGLTNNSIMQGSCCSNDDSYNGNINGIVVEQDAGLLTIANNQIALTNNNLSNPVSIRGIYEGISSTTNPRQRIVYNSIFIGGTATGNGGSAPLVFSLQPVKQVYNNLFYNKRVGGNTGHFAIRMPDPNSSANPYANAIANHNVYVLNDSTAFAQWGRTPKISWSTWKGNTKTDDSSEIFFSANLPAEQLFIDTSKGDLNINVANNTSWTVNNKAIALPDIADDYDSTAVRSTLPGGKTDIGADEFESLTPDPATVCGCQCRQFAATTIAGASYQWQVDTGAGFINITDNMVYSGTTTPVLSLQKAPDEWYNYRYRCVITNAGVQQTTKPQTLTFVSVWTGEVSGDWSDAANWSCHLVPGKNTDVVVNLGSKNYPLVDHNITIGSLYVQPGASFTIKSGFTVTLTH